MHNLIVQLKLIRNFKDNIDFNLNNCIIILVDNKF